MSVKSQAQKGEAAGIGTTSGGVTWSAGRPDYVDGTTPDDVAETIRLAIGIGLLPIGDACERVVAAREAADGIGSGGGANSLEELCAVGVRRVSMRSTGTFSFLRGAVPETTINGYSGGEQ